MKRMLQALLVSACLGAAATAHAVPALQLYSEGAVWDAVNETWVINSNSFDLWVLGDVSQGVIDPTYLSASFYGTGTLTLTPTTTSVVTDPSTPTNPVDLGSDESQFSGNQAFTGGVQNHDEYANADSHNFWSLGAMTLMDSPIYDYTNGGGSPSNDWGQINVYHVDISGYDEVHFDAFGSQNVNGTVKFVKAPFSHDATGGGTPPIPEPGTLAMMGAGLAGLAVRRLRRR